MTRREITIKGIISDFNIHEALRKGIKLDDLDEESIMSEEPFSADIDTPMEKLMDIMLENNFTMIPITKNGKLVGIVDRCAIMEGYVTPGFDRYLNEKK